jgi:two-component system sensor histidine kinase QseC
VDLVSELGRVASCPRTEPAESIDIARVLRDKASEAGGRADRLGVSLAVEAPSEFALKTRPKAFALLVRSLIDHALAATPRGGSVGIVLTSDSSGPLIAVKDGGTVVPVSARADLLEHRVDPASLGRPPGLGLLVANTVAAHLGTPARIVDSADAAGGSVVEVRPRAL